MLKGSGSEVETALIDLQAAAEYVLEVAGQLPRAQLASEGSGELLHALDKLAFALYQGYGATAGSRLP